MHCITDTCVSILGSFQFSEPLGGLIVECTWALECRVGESGSGLRRRRVMQLETLDSPSQVAGPAYTRSLQCRPQVDWQGKGEGVKRSRAGSSGRPPVGRGPTCMGGGQGRGLEVSPRGKGCSEGNEEG